MQILTLEVGKSREVALGSRNRILVGSYVASSIAVTSRWFWASSLNSTTGIPLARPFLPVLELWRFVMNVSKYA